MAKHRLSDSLVRRLIPPTKGLRIYRDQSLKGFGCRVLDSGSRSFVLDFTAPTGRRHIYTVAPFTGYGGDETGKARREALLLQARIRGTEAYDPAEAKRARRAMAAEAWSVEKLCDEYEREAERNVKRGKLRAKSRDQYLRYTGMLRTKFGTRLATSISTDELQRWLDQITDDSGPVLANAASRITHVVFRFAVEKAKVTSNPARGLARNKEQTRERVLDKPECKKVWDGSAGLDREHRDITRLLMLLGQRRTEIAEMRWSEVDFDKAELRLPPERTKNGRAHVVPLPPMALAILRKVPRTSETFVFSTNGTTPVANFSYVKVRIDKLSGVTNWCWHDLRRTCSTGMASLGVDLIVAEAILNHASGSRSGVAAVYNRHDYRKEARRALEAWERFLLQDEQPTIVDLNARRATGG